MAAAQPLRKTGGCVSLTVTVNEQLGPAVVHVTVVVPFGNSDPDAGVHVTVPQAPPEVVGVNVTTAPQRFGEFEVVMFIGQLIVQTDTVTVNWQLAVFELPSMTLQLTVVVPAGNNEPDAGEQIGVPTPEQLSLTVGAG